MTPEALFKRATAFVGTVNGKGQKRTPIYSEAGLRTVLVEFVQQIQAEGEEGKTEQREAFNTSRRGMKL